MWGSSLTKGRFILMNAEMIIGLVIISIVAGIMIIIGLFQLSKKDNPVGFYNGRSYHSIAIYGYKTSQVRKRV